MEVLVIGTDSLDKVFISCDYVSALVLRGALCCFSRVWEWCPPLARFLCSMEGVDAQPTVGRAYRPIHVDMASYIGHTRLLSPCPPALVVVVTAFDTAISAPNSLTCWDCEDDITCEEQSICASHRRQPDGQELAFASL